MASEVYEARCYDSQQPVRMSIAQGRIEHVEPLVLPAEQSASWPWVAPGFFDIQINGYLGQEFASSDLTPEKVVKIVQAMLPFGVTRLCPTLITNAFEPLAAGLRAIAQACEAQAWVNRMLPAIHLEGPYISPEDGPRGAHPREHVRAPDWDEFCKLQENAGGRIGLVTLAPERPGALEFIGRLVQAGVKVALGHTAAEPEVIAAAVDAGATLSTHLGNGAHAMLRRHPNYLWEQMAHDGLWASIICDGQHLPPAVVKCLVRAKTAQRVILVSDVVALAGLPAGSYVSEGVRVELLPDGRIVVSDQPQLLAGATRMIDTCVGNVQRFAEVSLRQAVEMASVHPARFFGLPEPSLAAGAPADLVFFSTPADQTDDASRVANRRTSLRIEATLLAGELRWKRVAK